MAELIPDNAQKWVSTISQYEKDFKRWEQRVEKIIKRYRDEPQNNRGYNLAKFNILWSNVQTAMPAVYSRMPRPDVSRRFRDNDPVARVASLLLERALTYEIGHYPDFRQSMGQVVLDRFLGGRGTAWVRYEPKFTPVPGGDYDGDEITEDVHLEGDAEEQASEALDYECAPVDYVHWKDFGHTIARTWEEVTAVWRKVYMGRNALIERFGKEIGNSVPLDTKPEDGKKYDSSDTTLQAVIYEIWDKESGNAIWLSKSLGKIIDQKQNPLELENFWPCPKPLFATLTNESLVPVPDFALYQDQANTLDILCDRIEGLVRAIQIKGGYDASIPELQRIFTEGENNTLIPIKNWQSFAEKNGLQGAISLVELQPIYQALLASYQAMEQQKNQIYEITGLSDIIRGQSVASETATAQQLKGQYASLRLKSMQEAVAIFATEILQIKAQIICKHFTTDTFLKIAGAAELLPADQQMVPQAIALLKQEDLSSFRIDIEADSMVMMDEAQDKQDRLEFLSATAGFLEKAVQAAGTAPEIVPLVLEMLKFGVTGFKIGKTIEGEFDAVAEQLKQVVAQKAANPQPNPEMMKLQAQQQQMQQQMQLDMAKHQAEMQQRQQEQQMQAAIEQQRNQMEAERANIEQHYQSQLQLIQDHNKAQMEMLRMQFEDMQTKQNNEVKILLAEIAANNVVTKQQDLAADDALSDEAGE